ncbi:hypothetical protein J2045_003381 [Peteryoungia aggregata LMG 23059]|uniref:Uncharacterized protein n=1 Tax=Peteryoungia aggregata LMG 23059 TaxID=1368425 RepID=A0ABU0GB51_9HYPH|nr:hypothetical protein [Peteryoungia aggregata]MDQ0422333.1 hypothetical protein [Peteryoungia aggregata LMG 23059]
MSYEEIIARELEFHSFDVDSGPDYLDFDFYWAGDGEKLRRVSLRFKSEGARFLVGIRDIGGGDGLGGWDFFEQSYQQHLPRLIDLLPPEELARLTVARMGLPSV